MWPLSFSPPPSSVSHSSLLDLLLCTWCGSPSSNHFISIPLLCSAPLYPLWSPSLHFSASVTPLTAPTPSLRLTCHCITVWLCVFGCLPHSPVLVLPRPPLPLLVKERMRLEREEATRLLEEETEVRFSSSAGPQGTCVSASGACRVKKTHNRSETKSEPGSANLSPISRVY